MWPWTAQFMSCTGRHVRWRCRHVPRSGTSWIARGAGGRAARPRPAEAWVRERTERRLRPTAARAPAAAQVQDTLTTAWHAAPSLADLDWPTLGSVLALVLATSLLTAWLSHLLNPVQRQMGTARAARPRAPRCCALAARAALHAHATRDAGQCVSFVLGFVPGSAGRSGSVGIWRAAAEKSCGGEEPRRRWRLCSAAGGRGATAAPPRRC